MATEEETKAEEAKKAAEEAEKAEAKPTNDAELRKQLDASAAQIKELIEGRDKAKQRAREAEDAKLAEQGEYKTISERLTAEKEQLAKDLEERDGLIGTYKERDEAEFAVLLEQVPEVYRDSISDETLPLAKRLELAKKFAEVKPGAPGPRPPGDSANKSISRQTFDEMTPHSKSEYVRGGGTITD